MRIITCKDNSGELFLLLAAALISPTEDFLRAVIGISVDVSFATASIISMANLGYHCKSTVFHLMNTKVRTTSTLSESEAHSGKGFFGDQ
jgi:hypothetical protein